jgi:hypothetical protein
MRYANYSPPLKQPGQVSVRYSENGKRCGMPEETSVTIKLNVDSLNGFPSSKKQGGEPGSVVKERKPRGLLVTRLASL